MTAMTTARRYRYRCHQLLLLRNSFQRHSFYHCVFIRNAICELKGVYGVEEPTGLCGAKGRLRQENSELKRERPRDRCSLRGLERGALHDDLLALIEAGQVLLALVGCLLVVIVPMCI